MPYGKNLSRKKKKDMYLYFHIETLPALPLEGTQRPPSRGFSKTEESQEQTLVLGSQMGSKIPQHQHRVGDAPKARLCCVSTAPSHRPRALLNTPSTSSDRSTPVFQSPRKVLGWVRLQGRSSTAPRVSRQFRTVTAVTRAGRWCGRKQPSARLTYVRRSWVRLQRCP